MHYQDAISHAWLGMLAVLIVMLIVDVLDYAMHGRYEQLSEILAHDPGARGLRVLVAMLSANSLIQTSVNLFSAAEFRVFIFICSIVYVLFFVAHQVLHLLKGESLGLHSVLDFTHHALGASAIWAAWNWINAV